ncbi:uncharacterized protein [Argopecten irradians]|uniref:uncharacterized protein n=1 Tax=Argopecten irradians TaxID=31199 RepID=UPI003711204B
MAIYSSCHFSPPLAHHPPPVITRHHPWPPIPRATSHHLSLTTHHPSSPMATYSSCHSLPSATTCHHPWQPPHCQPLRHPSPPLASPPLATPRHPSPPIATDYATLHHPIHYPMLHSLT